MTAYLVEEEHASGPMKNFQGVGVSVPFWLRVDFCCLRSSLIFQIDVINHSTVV